MSGFPLDIDEKLSLPPKTVGDILFIGEEEYSKMIGLLSIEKEDLIQDREKLKQLKNVGTFEIIANNCYYSIETRKQMIYYLQYFFNEEVGFLENMMCFYIGELKDERLLTKDNYNEFLHYMRVQNKIDNTKTRKKEKPKSKKMQMLLEKRDKGRKLMDKARGRDDIKLSDLALNLAVFLNGDFDACLKLTLYQFYELYQKMLRKERYQQNFDVYIAGGDPKQLDLDNHWTAKEVKQKVERPQSI